MLLLRASLLFGLIWTLTSFGFSAGALVTLLGQPSNISPDQLYAVVAVCVVSAIASLGLVALLALNLLGKRTVIERVPYRVLMAIGLAFCGVALYSFVVVHADRSEDFFRRFAQGARFEFLLIGVAALIMSVRKKA